jgi:hypothetical protein
MFMSVTARLLFVLAMSLPGLAAAAYSAANPKLASLPQNERPKKILLLPPQMFVGELSAGGVVQKQDDWTKQSSENLLSAAEFIFRQGDQFQPIRLPVISPEEMEKIEGHIGLYDRLALAIYIYGRGKDSAWKHRHEEWDYTLGDGLAFLREKTGADTALIFIGTDLISSSGRKAIFTVGLALGMALPLGQSFITVGLADLKTGDIRWMSYDQSLSLDSRDPAAAESLVRDFFEDYPRP